MWQTNGFSQDDAVGPFRDFLETETYLDWGKAQNECEQNSITLADALQGWLEEGGGIELFDTYTSFLLAVISILDEFVLGNMEQIVDTHIDPINERQVHVFQTIENSDTYETSFGMLFDFVGRTTFHPIMQQNWFEMLRARASRSR